MSRFTDMRDNVLHFLGSLFHAFADPLIDAIEHNGGQLLIDTALAAVSAAEAAGGSGSEKADAARKAIENTLRANGLPVVMNAVNGAIEMAVAKLKAAADQTAASPSNN